MLQLAGVALDGSQTKPSSLPYICVAEDSRAVANPQSMNLLVSPDEIDLRDDV